MDSNHISVRAIVRGSVQGVFYRASTKDKAEELGVSGWVRNRYDGSVEIYAQGKSSAVDALTEWARHGPPMATVTALEIQERVANLNPNDIAKSFAVRSTAG